MVGKADDTKPEMTESSAQILSVVGVGLDVVDLHRFREVVARTPTVVNRFTSDEERAVIGAMPVADRRLASRFAVKEAVMKALGAGLDRISLAEIDVSIDDRQTVRVDLTGRAAEIAEARSARDVAVSVSETSTVVTAVAIASR